MMLACLRQVLLAIPCFNTNIVDYYDYEGYFGIYRATFKDDGYETGYCS